MIADVINNKKQNSIVTELFISGRKLNISIVFITQSYFMVPKDDRLNSTHFFIMRHSDNRELAKKKLLKKLLKIIHQILALKISLISTKYILLNHILS